MMRSKNWIFWLSVCFLCALATACDEDDYNFGGDCKNDGHCGADLFCCTTGKCKHICTYSCSNDDHCPDDWACHSEGYCLFRCNNDGDCPGGYKCKNDGSRKFCQG